MDDRVRGTAAIAPMSTPMGERRQCGKRTLATHLSNELRPWLRVHSHAIVTIPRLISWSNRKCCERTLATNCVPGYGWQATMALQDRLSKPEVRHYCVYSSLLCSTPSIVFIARFCVQRPLLCLSPAFVFNALYCVYRPILLFGSMQ